MKIKCNCLCHILPSSIKYPDICRCCYTCYECGKKLIENYKLSNDYTINCTNINKEHYPFHELLIDNRYVYSKETKQYISR
jgi:hypothetical protein